MSPSCVRASVRLAGQALFSTVVATIISTQAQIVITLPNVNLLPNTPNQTVEVFVQNTSGNPFDVNGILLNLQVADGGPDVGGTVTGPTISSIDIITGTIFADYAANLASDPVGSQLYEVSTQTDSIEETVNIPPNSRLAVITFDTTGVDPGNYNYTLNTLNGETKYQNPSGEYGPSEGLQLNDGTLTVVPEPGTTALIGGLLCLGYAAGSRFRKKQ